MLSITPYAFLIVLVLLLVLAFSRQPVYGLFAYLLVFYNHPPNRWWGAALPDLRWSLIVALIAFAASLRRQDDFDRMPWYKNWGARILILFTALMWLQTPWAVDRVSHIEGCILFSKYLVLFFIIYRVISDEKTLVLFSFGHIVGCFIFGWIAFRDAGAGRFESVGGPGVNDANTLAVHLLTGLIFAGFLFLGCKERKRWLAFFSIPFILNGIILTVSRGAMLALAAAGLSALYFSPTALRKSVFISLALASVLLLTLGHDQFWQRLQTIFEKNEAGKYEGSAQSRIDLIKYEWDMSKDYPMGSGHGGHSALSPEYVPGSMLTGGRRGAHNTFMAVLVEQGFIGAALFVFLQLWAMTALLRLKKYCNFGLFHTSSYVAAALGVSFFSFFVASQFGNYIKVEVLIWQLGLLAAQTAIYEQRLSEQENLSSLVSDRTAIEDMNIPVLGTLVKK